MPKMIYADYNATAPLRPEAREAMLAAFELGANASSVHGPGRSARLQVERARSAIAQAIGARAQDVIFTSGGTEAAALALQGAVAQLEGNCTLLVSAIEHEAVGRNAGTAGAPVETVYVNANGQIDLDSLRARLSVWDKDRDGVPILALMFANNETGVIQPVREATKLVRDAGGLVICDAVQGLGKCPINVGLLGVDYLALSAHKVGGPQGVGALWLRSGAPLKPIVRGGGQERALRAGTENVAGIAGFGAATDAAIRDQGSLSALAPLRDQMEARLKSALGLVVFGEGVERLPQTSNFAIPNFRAETQVMALDLAGVAISSGAACSSGKVSRSLVLSAMGVNAELAECAVRISFGWDSKAQEFDAVANAWLDAARRVMSTRA
ncbi:MAG: cysteine desulfurase family protein [Pseudomonadota bacterium]